jgi:hypothetical protein
MLLPSGRTRRPPEMTSEGRKGRPDSGPTTITDEPDRTAAQLRAATARAGVRRYRARRWARRHLVVDHADDQAVTPVWPAPCARWHPGPCDYWGSCSGANLTIHGRDTAAAVHPWRLTA